MIQRETRATEHQGSDKSGGRGERGVQRTSRRGPLVAQLGRRPNEQLQGAEEGGEKDDGVVREDAADDGDMRFRTLSSRF